MSEPDNSIFKLLREIRLEMQGGFKEHALRFQALDKELGGLKSAVHGESVLGSYAAAQFDDRLSAIEKRLDRLEKDH
ncbi:MAG TPA: hypothetical protein VLA00_11450 [Xanthobacteraceae bacterium]|nr:hypothetical protein [Xanthobacteraceae bacterium]